MVCVDCGCRVSPQAKSFKRKRVCKRKNSPYDIEDLLDTDCDCSARQALKIRSQWFHVGRVKCCSSGLTSGSRLNTVPEEVGSVSEEAIGEVEADSGEAGAEPVEAETETGASNDISVETVCETGIEAPPVEVEAQVEEIEEPVGGIEVVDVEVDYLLQDHRDHHQQHESGDDSSMFQNTGKAYE